jgi:hypothetical protein
VNEELERIWKEPVATKFKVLTWHLSETEENHEMPVKIDIGPAEDRTGGRPNVNQKRY